MDEESRAEGGIAGEKLHTTYVAEGGRTVLFAEPRSPVKYQCYDLIASTEQRQRTLYTIEQLTSPRGSDDWDEALLARSDEKKTIRVRALMTIASGTVLRMSSWLYLSI